MFRLSTFLYSAVKTILHPNFPDQSKNTKTELDCKKIRLHIICSKILLATNRIGKKDLAT